MGEGEKDLLQRAKKGELDAFEVLIESYQKKVFNIALKMLGNKDDASELAQEVFIRIFKSINSFREEAGFSTWIYRITVNTCMDELRRRKHRKTISIDEEIRMEEGTIRRETEDISLSP